MHAFTDTPILGSMSHAHTYAVGVGNHADCQRAINTSLQDAGHAFIILNAPRIDPHGDAPEVFAVPINRLQVVSSTHTTK